MTRPKYSRRLQAAAAFDSDRRANSLLYVPVDSLKRNVF